MSGTSRPPRTSDRRAGERREVRETVARPGRRSVIDIADANSAPDGSPASGGRDHTSSELRSDRERVPVADAVPMRPDRRFALVCAPFRVLSHVHETVDQRRLLDAVHDGLEPGGPSSSTSTSPPQAAPGGDARDDRLRRRARPGPPPAPDGLVRPRRPLPPDEPRPHELPLGGRRRRAPRRLGVRDALLLPLRDRAPRGASKLALETMLGDFAGGRLTAASREYVVVCRRPGG